MNVRTLPRCKAPVGLGANRPIYPFLSMAVSNLPVTFLIESDSYYKASELLWNLFKPNLFPILATFNSAVVPNTISVPLQNMKIILYYISVFVRITNEDIVLISDIRKLHLSS